MKKWPLSNFFKLDAPRRKGLFNKMVALAISP